jgi:release factor glutamine methyltransferase
MPTRRGSDERIIVAGALYRGAVAALREAGIESAALDARVLLADALGIDGAELIALSDKPVHDDARSRFEALLKRRVNGEPVARILGKKEFWSREFSLSPATLVPRPETETLIEAALAERPDKQALLRVLDLGTGSGILLAALLLEYPKSFGVGIDREPEAARTARSNLALLGIAHRARIVCGDWAKAIGVQFDLVVSNPPYIASGDIAGLGREVWAHDPLRALDGGRDGLESYRAIVADLPRLLVPGGIAILELGAGQEPAVADLARHAQLTVNGPARCDLSGHPRALVLGRSR